MFDYAYYGNTISTPLIMQHIAPHASLMTSTAMSLIIFAVAAVPGYILAILTVDQIGHKRLQLIGFTGMGLMFLIIGLFPVLVSTVGLFLIVYGLSYFFAEFGPNTTTFLLVGEVFPVNLRTTGHGGSAGLAKVGIYRRLYLPDPARGSWSLRHAAHHFCVLDDRIGVDDTMPARTVRSQPGGREQRDRGRDRRIADDGARVIELNRASSSTAETSFVCNHRRSPR